MREMTSFFASVINTGLRSLATACTCLILGRRQMWVEMAALRMTRRETGLVALRIVIGFVTVLGWSIDSRAQEDPLTALLAHPCTEPWGRADRRRRLERLGRRSTEARRQDRSLRRSVARTPFSRRRSRTVGRYAASRNRQVFSGGTSAARVPSRLASLPFRGLCAFEPLFLTFLAPVARGGQPLATRIRIPR